MDVMGVRVPGSGAVLTLVQSWFWENKNHGKDQNRELTLDPPEQAGSASFASR